MTDAQQKAFGSYDYFEDLIKQSKNCKFTPLTHKQNEAIMNNAFGKSIDSNDLLAKKNIIFQAKEGLSKNSKSTSISNVKFTPSQKVESKYSRKNYKKEINKYFYNKGINRDSKQDQAKLQRVFHKCKANKDLSKDDLNLSLDMVVELDKMLKDQRMTLPNAFAEKLPENTFELIKPIKNSFTIHRTINLNIEPNRDEISNIKLNAHSKIDSKWNELQTKSPVSVDSVHDLEKIEALKGQDSEILGMFSKINFKIQICTNN